MTLLSIQHHALQVKQRRIKYVTPKKIQIRKYPESRKMNYMKDNLVKQWKKNLSR